MLGLDIVFPAVMGALAAALVIDRRSLIAAVAGASNGLAGALLIEPSMGSPDVDPEGSPTLHPGVEGLAVVVAIAVVAWRRNLLLALLATVGLRAWSGALGLAA